MSYLRAFSTLGCPELSLDEVLVLAERHGMSAVELRALGGTTGLPEYFSQQFGSPENVAAADRSLRSRPRIVGLNTSFKLSDTSSFRRQELLRFVPWAEAMQVPRLRVFDGGGRGDDAELEQAAETLAWWRELRASHSWRTDLMIETHDSFFTAETIARFLSLVPDAAVLWDTHHTWKRGGELPSATWRAIKANVVHIHVKDSISRPSLRHPFTYVIPGHGEFPSAELFAALRADQFAGPVSLEWEKLWNPELPSLHEALTAANAKAWW
ncbi:MAG: TIM barrel protein [Opitutaceae bacterium]